jgi:hypothetical protein
LRRKPVICRGTISIVFDNSEERADLETFPGWGSLS